MSNQPNPKVPVAISPPDNSRLARVARSIDRAGRIALCLVIVGAVVFSLQTVQQIRSSDDRMSDPQATTPQEPMQDALVTLLNGEWSFAGVPWGVSTREINQAEMEQQLQASLGKLHSLPTSSSVRSPDDYAMLTSILDMLDAKQTQAGPNISYHVHTPDLRVVAYAPHDQPRHVQLARFAQRLGEDHWNYVEVVRRGDGQAAQSPDQESLLPVTPEDTRLALRRDARGVLCAELVECRTSLQDLQALWTAAGWTENYHADDPSQIAQTDMGSLSPLPMQELWLYTRGAETVVVVASRPADSGPQTLLLIRPLETSQPSKQ